MLPVWHRQKWPLSRLRPYYASRTWAFYNHFLTHSLRHHCLGLIRMNANISSVLRRYFIWSGRQKWKGQVFLLKRQTWFLFDKLSLLLLYTCLASSSWPVRKSGKTKNLHNTSVSSCCFCFRGWHNRNIIGVTLSAYCFGRGKVLEPPRDFPQTMLPLSVLSFNCLGFLWRNM